MDLHYSLFRWNVGGRVDGWRTLKEMKRKLVALAEPYTSNGRGAGTSFILLQRCCVIVCIPAGHLLLRQRELLSKEQSVASWHPTT